MAPFECPFVPIGHLYQWEARIVLAVCTVRSLLHAHCNPAPFPYHGSSGFFVFFFLEYNICPFVDSVARFTIRPHVWFVIVAAEILLIYSHQTLCARSMMRFTYRFPSSISTLSVLSVSVSFFFFTLCYNHVPKALVLLRCCVLVQRQFVSSAQFTQMTFGRTRNIV